MEKGDFWLSILHGSFPCRCKWHAIADMLAHSPPLPLFVDYFGEVHDITTDDEEGIILTLKQRDRVRLKPPVTSLQRSIVVIEKKYPILECLVIEVPVEGKSTDLRFPETLQASSTTSTPPQASGSVSSPFQ